MKLPKGVVSKNDTGERKIADNAILNKLRLADKLASLLYTQKNSWIYAYLKLSKITYADAKLNVKCDIACATPEGESDSWHTQLEVRTYPGQHTRPYIRFA